MVGTYPTLSGWGVRGHVCAGLGVASNVESGVADPSYLRQRREETTMLHGLLIRDEVARWETFKTAEREAQLRIALDAGPRPQRILTRIAASLSTTLATLSRNGVLLARRPAG
jgi:hypothetical protein